MIEELKLAMLLKDIPKKGLSEGSIGTVVMVYNEGEGYEVEFLKEDGSADTKALVTLVADDVREVSPEEYDSLKNSRPAAE